LHQIYSSLNKIILNKIEKKKLIENYKKILIAISPIIPHFSSECIEMMNIKDEISWPEVDESLLIEDNIKYIIQINGKTRTIIETKKDISEESLIVKIKEDNKLNKFLNNKNIQKKIFIPNKLINIITT
jgi:leucyl-tRNA synthetase